MKKLTCQECEQRPAMLRVCCWDSVGVLLDEKFVCESCAKGTGLVLGNAVAKKGWADNGNGTATGA